MRSGDMSRARQLLVDDLESLSQLKGWRIEVVFDGAGRSRQGVLGKGPGLNKPTAEDRSLKKDVSKHGVRVVYTGVGVEADAYIESRCADAKSVTSGEFSRSFIVATDDAMIRVAGISAGALCMSAGRFVDELKAVKKAIEYRVEVAVAKANGHSVRHEKLRGTAMPSFSRSVLVVDKRNKTQYIYSAYGGGIRIIEDRKKLKKDNTSSVLQDIPIEPKDKREIPIWARVPNQTRTTS
jgi:predicted RNA-binding protein with PIN domain